MTMNNDTSNTYRHIKLYPDIAGAHYFIIDKILYITLGYIFSSNIVSYRQEIIAIVCCCLSEYYQSHPDVLDLIAKYSYLIDKIPLPNDVFQYQRKIMSTILDSINTGFIHNRVEELTANNMYVDDNLMVNIQKCLCITLACSIEALFNILGYLDETIRKSPLSIDKYFDSMCSYSRK